LSQYSLAFAHGAFSGLIGVAREDITPPTGIYARNWGAAIHDTAEGIHRSMAATVLVLRGRIHDPPLVLVTADLGWWRTQEDEWALRGDLIDSLALDPARVLISLSHTHAGPSICRDDRNKPGGELIEPYLDHLQKAILGATRRALALSEPAILSWAYGKCNLATHRDLPDPEKPRIVCGYNPHVPADDTLLVGRVTTVEGKPLATLVNYACHPTTLAWQNRLISPDYVGVMRETVEAHTAGAPCLFLLGACGELAPREQYTGDTSIADAHGRQLGFAVLATLQGMLPSGMRLEYTGVLESGAPLAMWEYRPSQPSDTLAATIHEVELPLKDWPTTAEIDALLATCKERVMAERLLRNRRVRQTVGDGKTSKMPFWVWRIGDAVLVATPNEAYSALQTALRRQFADHPLIVVNLANGPCVGYLPPEKLYYLDIYQVWQTPFEKGSHERLAEACMEAIRSIIGQSNGEDIQGITCGR
jgi:hypothetical protein